MDELVKFVVSKTGLPEATAKQAVQAVLDYLKTQLPAPLGGQIEALLSGGGLDQAVQGLGGLLGK